MEKSSSKPPARRFPSLSQPRTKARKSELFTHIPCLIELYVHTLETFLKGVISVLPTPLPIRLNTGSRSKNATRPTPPFLPPSESGKTGAEGLHEDGKRLSGSPDTSEICVLRIAGFASGDVLAAAG